jgi:hypothetical protein
VSGTAFGDLEEDLGAAVRHLLAGPPTLTLTVAPPAEQGAPPPS